MINETVDEELENIDKIWELHCKGSISERLSHYFCALMEIENFARWRLNPITDPVKRLGLQESISMIRRLYHDESSENYDALIKYAESRAATIMEL